MMRALVNSMAVVVGALCLASCGDNPPTDPTDAPLFEGLNITASVVLLQEE